MKKHKPDPTCLDLWENRARKFQLLRDLYFVKTPAQKLMLCVLELTIGNYRELRIPMRTLREGDIVDAFGLDGADRYRPVVTLMKTNSDELFAMLISSFLERLRDGRTSGLGELDDIVQIADQLGITLDQFAPDVEMLEDLPEQARLSLFDEWEGLKPAKTPKGQAEQLIDHWEEGWIPEAFKAVELDGVSF